jgi:2',3'-cyclic-nucleotide 2'-phosphodiesterase (5'-nucleotidase family)
MKESVLILDAGNALYASKGPAKTTRGQVTIEAMNRMGYDAMTLGYRDLFLGRETLTQRMTEANFAVLSANVINRESGELFALPYVVKRVDGHQVGIIGVTNTPESLPTAEGAAEFEVTDPRAAIPGYVKEVAEVADIIVLLSHLGLEADQEISAEFPQIDVVIGGYSRKVLPPRRFQENRAVIGQAGYRGEWMGRLDIEFDRDGVVTAFEGRAEPLTKDVGTDSEMAAFVREIKQ